MTKEQLYGFLIALAVGVIVALVGYFLNLNATKQERKERAKEQLRSATYGLSVELEANLRLAKQPFEGRIMLPFATEMWDYHKGEVLALPEEAQSALYQAYICIREANAIVENNLQLPYGLGYYNKHYENKRNEIEEKAGKANELLRSWLGKEDTHTRQDEASD